MSRGHRGEPLLRLQAGVQLDGAAAPLQVSGRPVGLDVSGCPGGAQCRSAVRGLGEEGVLGGVTVGHSGTPGREEFDSEVGVGLRGPTGLWSTHRPASSPGPSEPAGTGNGVAGTQGEEPREQGHSLAQRRGGNVNLVNLGLGLGRGSGSIISTGRGVECTPASCVREGGLGHTPCPGPPTTLGNETPSC